MIYIDKEGRPYSKNVCYISNPFGNADPFNWQGGGTLGDVWGGGGTLGDLAGVAKDTWNMWTGKTNETDDANTQTGDGVTDVEDKEELGDELRAKQGTDVSIPVIYGTRRMEEH